METFRLLISVLSTAVYLSKQGSRSPVLGSDPLVVKIKAELAGLSSFSAPIEPIVVAETHSHRSTYISIEWTGDAQTLGKIRLNVKDS